MKIERVAFDVITCDICENHSYFLEGYVDNPEEEFKELGWIEEESNGETFNICPKCAKLHERIRKGR